MKSLILSILIGLGIVIIIGASVYKSRQNRAYTPLPETTTSSTTTGDMRMTQVTTHNSRTSCWSAINGSVYDLTSWIPNHPGGEQAILSICGKDGSSTFNAKHGGQAKQLNILMGFKIGVLAK